MTRVLEALRNDEMLGICKKCGDESSDHVKPDARARKCTTCGARAVYGVSELLLEGY